MESKGWDSKEFVLNKIIVQPQLFYLASEEIKCDKEFVLNANSINGHCLMYAGGDLCDDKEVVLVAVKQNWRALRWASERMRGDKEVVLEACKGDGLALKYATRYLERKVAGLMVFGVTYPADVLQMLVDKEKATVDARELKKLLKCKPAPKVNKTQKRL